MNSGGERNDFLSIINTGHIIFVGYIQHPGLRAVTDDEGGFCLAVRRKMIQYGLYIGTLAPRQKE